MGNASSRDQRSPPSTASLGQAQGQRPNDGDLAQQTSTSGDRLTTTLYSARSGRGSNHNLSFLGIGSSSHAPDPPEVRRETKQEREARKLEKERIAREKERERSMKEEHVDGGYLVTQGVYTGIEDYSKTVVRQLMIERRMAPFWRGLNDFKEDWTEHQLVAAGQGLPIPAADEIPPQEERPQSPESPQTSTANLQHLTVPMSSRSQSYDSNASPATSPSQPAFSLPAPTSPMRTSTPPTSFSPFRPRSKTLASLTTSSKSASQTDLVPREVQLPKDPYVNGQRMEAFLYKDASECPICFLYYPPYLNKTRCCDQPICSECFVQIKRPDPHLPEHEHPDSSNPPATEATAATGTATENPTESADLLVSEPANCPYCQQAEFGVTYEPPPFRRGLTYANNGPALGSVSSAMSSSSSLNSMGSPTLKPPTAGRRRTTSISASSSIVITTDKVRPDWATKLANARNHAARRSAAATALHTAAYLMGNGVSSESRSFAFSGRSRFGRHRSENSPGGSGAATPSGGGPDIAARLAAFSTLAEQHSARQRENEGSGSNRRRSRMDDLEDMMMMEAIRLSLAAEEERKRKGDKEARKEAKRREKAEKKAAKKGLYGSGNSSASASGSALSLALPGVGRRRGNSGSSLFAREAEANNADKGKSVDRGGSSGEGQSSDTSSPIDFAKSSNLAGLAPPRQTVDTGLAGFAPIDIPQASPTTTAPEKPSHLRQMSNASSPASSFIESVPGSLRNGFHRHNSSSTTDSPNASGTHLGSTPDADGGAGTEPMFNFRSLAAMVGREEEKENELNNHVEYTENNGNGSVVVGRERGESSASHANPADDPMEESVTTLKAEVTRSDESHNLNGSAGKLSTPELMITPVTPAAVNSVEEDSKQLGQGMAFAIEHGRTATQ